MRRILLMLILACASPAGCAALDRRGADADRGQGRAARPGADDHAELERELSLYSD